MFQDEDGGLACLSSSGCRDIPSRRAEHKRNEFTRAYGILEVEVPVLQKKLEAFPFGVVRPPVIGVLSESLPVSGL